MSNKLEGGLIAGSVDISIPVILRATADNTGVTGKAYGDATGSYWRQGGIRVDIPCVTLAAVNSAHDDGGFKEVDSTNMPGSYRFDIPDAAAAVGADWVVIAIKVAGAYIFYQLFYLTASMDLSTEIAAIISLLDDARSEPGDTAPPVNADAMTKLDYLYKFMRNKIETTATRIHVYDDAGANKDHSSVISDDATTFIRGEFGAGD